MVRDLIEVASVVQDNPEISFSIWRFTVIHIQGSAAAHGMKAEKEVMERLEVISKGKEEEEDNPVEDEDPTIWLFHGTTAEDVQKVFESTSLQGKINRDFNIEGSFYLTSSFAWAAQTAGLRSRSASPRVTEKMAQRSTRVNIPIEKCHDTILWWLLRRKSRSSMRKFSLLRLIPWKKQHIVVLSIMTLHTAASTYCNGIEHDFVELTRFLFPETDDHLDRKSVV